MELILRPFEGLVVDDRFVLRLGEPARPQLAALMALGAVEPFSRTPGDQGWMVQLASQPEARTVLFAYANAAGCLDAVEVARPWGGEAGSLTVQVDGIDVFGQSADDILAAMAAAGAELTSTEAGHSCIDVVRSIGLWRDGEPSGRDGVPVNFDGVLIAVSGYYAEP